MKLMILLVFVLVQLLLALCSGVFAAENAPIPAHEGLLLEYTFEGDVADSSGSGHNGSPVGNPTYTEGRVGKGLVLDGEGDYIDCGLAPAELGQTFTVEAWVKPDAKQNLNADIFGNHDHGGLGFVLQQDGANTNRFTASLGVGANQWVLARSVQLVAGRWQHVALVKTPDRLTFFFNGVAVASAPLTAPMASSPTTLRVGLGFGGLERCFCGYIDEFRLWNKAITEFDLELSQEEKLMPIAESLRLEWRSVSTAQGAAEQPEWEFSLPAELAGRLQDRASSIEVSAEAVSWSDNRKVSLPIPPLMAQSGFKAVVEPQLPPGAYTVKARPYLLLDGKRMEGEAHSFTWLSEGPVITMLPLEPGATVESPIATLSSRAIPLDGPDWKIATDPDNSGREQSWFDAPPADTRSTKVPWVIQDIFPEYHGVAWYWREFEAPANPHTDGRTLLRFEAVDYLAEVWVNGKPVGGHEGSETPFEFDVTDAVHPGASNLLAVRVLNPTNEPLDGIVLSETARSCKTYPVSPGAIYNVGGIVDSVSLLLKPRLRIQDVYVVADWKTGAVRVQADVFSSAGSSADALMRIRITDAREGNTVAEGTYSQSFAAAGNRVQAELQVPHHRLWELDDPSLYRVTVELASATSRDEKQVRFGFRDFRFEDGYFRLNGKRIYLQGALILPIYPVGFRLPPNEDYVRRDVMAYKAMGLNICRIIWGGLRARDLDLFDELGLLVQQEHYGAIQMTPSPELERRFDQSLMGVIIRDRNHPSIVTWCLLNEMFDGPQFHHAASSLPLLKSLDDTRLMWLNSGGFDMTFSQGSLSNPGSLDWQYLMGSEAPDGPTQNINANMWLMLDNKGPVKADIHPYQNAPHTTAEIDRMRTLGQQAGDKKILISEIGTGCAINLPRFARLYEQMGADYAEDARYYRYQLDLFMADWTRWNLGRIWTRPEDFFLNSELNMLKLRRETGNALRSNPYLAGYYFCALPDSDFNGVGLLNLFREYKPGVVDLQRELTSPVRWSLFVDPVTGYSDSTTRLEVMLSNLDALRAGDYPVRIEVVAPGGARVFEERLTITVPDTTQAPEPPLVQKVFSKEVSLTGPAGVYKLLAYFESGAAATGEEIEFRVYHADEMPAVTSEVVLWGEDEELAKWLADQGINTRAYSTTKPEGRELILVGSGGSDPAAFHELVGRLASGSTAVFLTTAVFNRGDQPLALLPLETKGTLTPLDFVGGYYRGDTFATQHPVFEGLPADGILDYTIYRSIIPQGGISLAGAQAPDDLIVAGIRAQFGYASGLLMAGYKLGAGRFFINTLRLRENLGQDPVAERLLRNLLNYAASELDQPVAELPADFDQQLKAIGYD